MSAAQVILQLLRENPQGLYGLELIRLSKGQLHRATVYVHLASLEDEGLVRRQEEAGRPRFFLTRSGLRAPVDGEQGPDLVPA